MKKVLLSLLLINFALHIYFIIRFYIWYKEQVVGEMLYNGIFAITTLIWIVYVMTLYLKGEI